MLRVPGNASRSAAEEGTSRVKRNQFAVLIVALAVCFAVITFRERPLTADIHANELVVDGTSRNYRLVIPHETVGPMPIVFAFHGVGDSTESMAGYSGLDRTAARNGFLLVYPAARNSMWATIDVDPSNLDANPCYGH